MWAGVAATLRHLEREIWRPTLLAQIGADNWQGAITPLIISLPRMHAIFKALGATRTTHLIHATFALGAYNAWLHGKSSS